MEDEEPAEVQLPAQQDVPKLCATVHRCFPPKPDICLICDETDPSRCPWRRG